MMAGLSRTVFTGGVVAPRTSVLGLFRVSKVAGPVSKCSRVKTLVTSAAQKNTNTEYVIVGGGNAAGYAAKAFVENGAAEGKVCIVAKENVAPYERPALTKAYLFPVDKSPARLPGFHTSVGGGGERQTPDWYKEKGIEVLYGTEVTGLDIDKQSLTTSSGDTISYNKLIIATGCTASRLPEKIGGSLRGVHYIRDVADADQLVAALQSAKKVVVIGGGYIGLEVSAAVSAWKLDVTVVFPEQHVMPRLFTPTIAAHYEELYKKNNVKIIKEVSVVKLKSGANGEVDGVELTDGTTLDADLVVVGVGARPVVAPFLDAGLKSEAGAIEVDGMFNTSSPGVYAIGDVAAFPLKIYDRRTRVEHVDHARLLDAQSGVTTVDSSVGFMFTDMKVGECVEVGNFDPKYAAFWIESGRVKGVFLESGSAEEFALLPKLARQQPAIDIPALKSADSVETALQIAQEALGKQKVATV
ncbi:hypothetical protein AXG93_4577s1150 [Marchantia polymorpha subsp. ruderalis]|uniref:monodehydroascorbate reductase (NADH) n=1 Tax=Marchantia polymorpha subsp. ruderalis TaxID=1480154 RepID=A0A176W5Z0_MARPO|nr:hypothetical protein AXG93_4577s1150 [Marchantia polymorpha subsp. ruderalis]